jgi:hypothetical protein
MLASARPFLFWSLPGEDPAIQWPQQAGFLEEAWMRGSSPRMTIEKLTRRLALNRTAVGQARQ